MVVAFLRMQGFILYLYLDEWLLVADVPGHPKASITLVLAAISQLGLLDNTI